MSSRPSFDSLPLRKDGPHGNAWGLYGDDDECGTLNIITPGIVTEAAKEIRDGVSISLDYPLNRMAPPCFGRAPFKQHIHNKAPRAVNDDTLEFNTQSSSQWDGFRHFAYQKEKLWYNGKTLDDLMHSDVIGMQAWADRGGIVGRGIFLDYAAWADAQGIQHDHFSTTSISAATLKKVAASQGVTGFRRGDVLFFRTGWGRAYDTMIAPRRQALSEVKVPPAIGLESSEATLRWLWDEEFAAVASDCPSLEAWPCTDPKFMLHEWCLAGWGMPLGELFDLERLSEECRKRNRWTFFFTSTPLRVPGGVASPPNGIAIF